MSFKKQTKIKIVLSREDVSDLDDDMIIENVRFEKINNKFIYGIYSNVKIIIMEKNGYINASRLCKKSNKYFGDWKSDSKSKKLVKFASNELGIVNSDLMLKIKNNNNSKINGTYVSDFLISSVSNWISPEINMKVLHILNEYKILKIKEEYTIQLRKQKEKLITQSEKIKTLSKQSKKYDNVLIIIKNNDKYSKFDYSAIRCAFSSVPSLLSKHKKNHKNMKIILQLDHVANSKTLWNEIREKLEYGPSKKRKIECDGRNFNLINGFSKHELIKTINRLHNNS